MPAVTAASAVMVAAVRDDAAQEAARLEWLEYYLQSQAGQLELIRVD